jgi:hypothetical protein
MALSTKWSRIRIREAVRRELLDPSERWWSNAELDRYISAWQDRLQEQFEFVWTSTSVVTDSATHTLTALATDILRFDGAVWNGVKLSGRLESDLDLSTNTDWRSSTSNGTPTLVYQTDNKTFVLFPPPDGTGTLTIEYPKLLSFATDTSTHEVPAWTKYSAVNYCVYRAFSRFGPNQDLNIASRRRAKWTKQLKRFKTFLTNIFPSRYPTLSPMTQYERDIILPR